MPRLKAALRQKILMAQHHASCLRISFACLSLRKTASASPQPRPHCLGLDLGVRLPWLVPIAAALVVTVTLSPSSLLIFIFTVFPVYYRILPTVLSICSLALPHPVSLLPPPCLASHLSCFGSPCLTECPYCLTLPSASEKMPQLHHCR